MIFSDYQINTLIELIKDCGITVAGAHNVEKSKDNISEKYGAANFVTVYDVSVQQKLISGISALFPNAVFIAEENSEVSDQAEKGLCFVIDPIDGTTNFIHDLHASAISVGAMIDSKPVLGIIYDPYMKEIFTAQAGGGAYLNGEPIHCSSRTLDKALVSVGTSPYNRFEYLEKTFGIAKALFSQCADIRRSGSAAIDLASVACGRTDAFFESILSPWDYAAGYVLVTEAGGTLTDFSGSKVSFTTPSSMLCANSLIHSQIIDIIGKIK